MKRYAVSRVWFYFIISYIVGRNRVNSVWGIPVKDGKSNHGCPWLGAAPVPLGGCCMFSCLHPSHGHAPFGSSLFPFPQLNRFASTNHSDQCQRRASGHDSDKRYHKASLSLSISRIGLKIGMTMPVQPLFNLH